MLWHAAWPRRRYACAAVGRLARVRAYLRGWAAVPASVRAMPDLPADTGAGPTLRWERRWVLRPDRGWRSWRCTPPRYANHELSRGERDAATDWALEVLAVR
ncbi:MAG: hypothetical protein ACRDTF_15325 [Pseudonocardiaceae bacterium]